MYADPDYKEPTFVGKKIREFFLKLFKPIVDAYNSVPTWAKVFMGIALIGLSIAAAFVSQGRSLGWEIGLLGASEAAMSAAAELALIELAVGVGINLLGWAISSAVSNNWSADGAANAVADAIFMTGLFMFISSSVNTIKVISRSSPYPQLELAKVANRSDEAMQIFNDFDVNNAYVKNRHLATDSGNFAKFIYGSKTEAEAVLRNTITRGDIVSVAWNRITPMGYASYKYTLNAWQVVGMKGETGIVIVLAKDGGMLTAFPKFI